MEGGCRSVNDDRKERVALVFYTFMHHGGLLGLELLIVESEYY